MQICPPCCTSHSCTTTSCRMVYSTQFCCYNPVRDK